MGQLSGARKTPALGNFDTSHIQKVEVPQVIFPCWKKESVFSKIYPRKCLFFCLVQSPVGQQGLAPPHVVAVCLCCHHWARCVPHAPSEHLLSSPRASAFFFVLIPDCQDQVFSGEYTSKGGQPKSLLNQTLWVQK